MFAPAIDRGRKAGLYPVPAPVGGLNARDPLAAMPETDASVMENLFPDTSSVGTRKGHEAFADGTALFENGGTVPNDFYTYGFHGLATWNSGSSSKLFAMLLRNDFNTGDVRWRVRIYEVATNGTLTLSETVNLTTGQPNAGLGESVMFVTGSSTPYMVVRFSDGAADFTRAYDGSSWTTPSITGLPTFGAIGLTAHRHRLWFYGKDLTAYYLPINAISGAVTSFNFGNLFSKGGRIVSMRSWTLDGGDGGTDDLLVVLTNMGQMAVYSGYDPVSQATWSLVGVFDVGRPASRQSQVVTASNDAIRGGAFMMQFGADLLMVLGDGVMSASRVLRPAEGQQDYSISGKINSLIREAAATYGADGSTNAGMWSITFLPRLKQVLLNIPTVAAVTNSSSARCTSITYVMNTETGAWTKFTGMSYLDATVWRGDLYLVAGGYYVYRYGQVNADLGSNITWEARQAYSYLNSPSNKHVTLLQPVMRWTGNFSMTAEVDVDFNPGSISTYTSYTLGAEANVQPWLSANKFGRTAAVHIKGQTSAGVGSWFATNLAAKPSAGIA